MRIILASWACPICARTGIERRAAALFSELQLRSSVVVICGCERGHAEGVALPFIVVPVRRATSFSAKVASRVAALVKGDGPTPFSLRSEARLRKMLRSTVRKDDVLIYMGLASWQAFAAGSYSNHFRIYDALLMEGDTLRVEAAREGGLHRKRLQLDAYLAARTEMRACKQASAVSATTEADRIRLASLGATETILAQNGVSQEFFAVSRTNIDMNEVVYTGAVTYGPNLVAVREIEQHLLAFIPDVRLTVTGDLPAASDLPTFHARTTFTGPLDDVRTALSTPVALLAPLHTGGGSRLKIVEAMAAGLPVIATQDAMAGLNAEPGVHYMAIFNSDIVEPFLQLRNADLREGIVEKARLFAEQLVWASTLAPLVQKAASHGE